MDIDALILCGGKGTRFEQVSKSKPKALADIKGIPLIELIIQKLEKNGFTRFILAVGFRNEQIIKYFEGTKRNIIFSLEDKPLGTGGAIKLAQKYINSKIFLVMNGDLICDMHHDELIQCHIENNKPATIVLSHSKDAEDYGNITLDKDNNIESFSEKTKKKLSNFVNAGTYIMDKDIFSLFPRNDTFSIEKDFFERNPRKLNAHIIKGSFIDVGTPERFREVNKLTMSD